MRIPAALFLLLLFLLPKSRAAEAPAVTRGEFVVLLWESGGGVPYDANTVFLDVPRDAFCSTALGWAYGNGLVRGTGGGLFEPERPITREEAAVLMRRWSERHGRDTALPSALSACNDDLDRSPWADDSLYWATGTGLMDYSTGGRLDPYGSLSRAEAGAILDRFLYAQP